MEKPVRGNMAEAMKRIKETQSTVPTEVPTDYIDEAELKEENSPVQDPDVQAHEKQAKILDLQEQMDIAAESYDDHNDDSDKDKPTPSMVRLADVTPEPAKQPGLLERFKKMMGR